MTDAKNDDCAATVMSRWLLVQNAVLPPKPDLFAATKELIKQRNVYSEDLALCISILENNRRRAAFSSIQDSTMARRVPVPTGSSAWDPAGPRGSDNFYGTLYNVQRNGKPAVKDVFSAKDGALLAKTILSHTEFYKFATAGLMNALVQVLRLRSIPANKWIVEKGEPLPQVLFLLRGHVGVYEVVVTPSGDSTDDYGDTIAEASSRRRVLNPLSTLEEKASLFGKESNASYKTLRFPGQAHANDELIFAYIPLDGPSMQEICSAIIERYTARVAFTRVHIPSAHAYTEKILEKVANACAEEVYMHRASLGKLVDRVNTRSTFAVICCGVVVCGPFNHPHMELQPGAILGIQSKASYRGGVWAKGNVMVRTWPYTKIVIPRKFAVEDDAEKPLEMTLTVVKKVQQVPSANQILKSLSSDHLQSVGGKALQARLDRYRTITTIPKKQFVSKPSSPWKWGELQKLCGTGVEEVIDPSGTLKRRSPPTKGETLSSGPRSFALKNAQAWELLERQANISLPNVSSRPTTANVRESPFQSAASSRPATAPGLRTKPPVTKAGMQLGEEIRPRTAEGSRTKIPNSGPARPKTSNGVRTR